MPTDTLSTRQLIAVHHLHSVIEDNARRLETFVDGPAAVHLPQPVISDLRNLVTAQERLTKTLQAVVDA